MCIASVCTWIFQEDGTCMPPPTCISTFATTVPGFATLPHCEGTTAGSIECTILPACARGYFGAPSLADITCLDDGAELSISGCFPCTPVPYALPPFNCTNSANTQILRCATGFYVEDQDINGACVVCDNAVADVCIGCTPVNNSVGQILCSNATDSMATSCVYGYVLQVLST